MRVFKNMPDLIKEKISVYENLSERYKEVLFSSIITSFGLDSILFRNDETNGHVDTLHNVVESAKDGKEPLFKSKYHQDKYSKRGDYNSVLYHSTKAYKDKGVEWNKKRETGNLKDAYTGKTIKKHEKYDRDHVIAAKTIHEDPRRALSALKGEDLANQDINLQPTHPSINRSKGADSTEVYLAKLADRRKEHQNEVKSLKAAIADGSAPKGANKRLENLEARLAVDETHMKEVTRNTEKAMSRQHNIAYYTSKDFIGTTSSHALKAGFKMGARQGLGVIMLELSVALQKEIPLILQRWQDSPTWKEKLDIKSILEHMGAVLRNTWQHVKEKLSHIFREIKSGFAAGVLSEVMTTVINIFTGTAKRLMKMLRNFWSAIVSSLRILVLNPSNLKPEEKISAVMLLLSAAVGAIIQPIISEAIDKLLLSGLPLPSFLREVLSEFSGAALGGLISVTLVYVIDNSPIVQRIVEIMNKVGDLTELAYQQISKIIGIGWQELKKSVESISNTSVSPAVDFIAFSMFPPLGLALHAFRINKRLNHIETGLDDIQNSQQRIESKVANLDSVMRESFISAENLIRENMAFLHCVLNNQEQQLTKLAEIRDEIRHGIVQIHGDIHQAKHEIQDDIHQSQYEISNLVAIRQLQDNQSELLANYRDCAAILQRGEKPLQRDLEKIEELASALISKIQINFDHQTLGSPARLPLLIGMAFTLSIWRDTRNALGDGLDMCLERGKAFENLALKELQNLVKGAKIWQLEEKAWLIGQYILLRRALAKMPTVQKAIEKESSDNYIPNSLSCTIIGWNDRLDDVRQIFIESKQVSPELEPNIVLEFSSDSEKKRYHDFLPVSNNIVTISDIKSAFGLPDTAHLTPRMVFDLLNQAEKAIFYYKELEKRNFIL